MRGEDDSSCLRRKIGICLFFDLASIWLKDLPRVFRKQPVADPYAPTPLCIVSYLLGARSLPGNPAKCPARARGRYLCLLPSLTLASNLCFCGHSWLLCFLFLLSTWLALSNVHVFSFALDSIPQVREV